MSEKKKTPVSEPFDPGLVALVGIPFDEFSSFMRGPAKAPPLIRQTLHNGASNPFKAP